jgi:hypothetical protein
MIDAFQEGYNAQTLYDCPYWKNYPKETTEEDKVNAYKFVDGHAQKAIDEKYGQN